MLLLPLRVCFPTLRAIFLQPEKVTRHPNAANVYDIIYKRKIVRPNFPICPPTTISSEHTRMNRYQPIAKMNIMDRAYIGRRQPKKQEQADARNDNQPCRFPTNQT